MTAVARENWYNALGTTFNRPGETRHRTIGAGATAIIMIEHTDPLVLKYIDQESQPSPAEARLRHWGVAVWALVSYLRRVEWDVERAAKDYEIPVEAVRAALAYYDRQKSLIDARIALNDAAFAA